MSFKLLTEHHLVSLSLKGNCTCSSKSTLVKMPHCWKSHVTAHASLCSDADLLVPKPLPYTKYEIGENSDQISKF